MSVCGCAVTEVVYFPHFMCPDRRSQLQLFRLFYLVISRAGGSGGHAGEDLLCVFYNKAKGLVALPRGLFFSNPSILLPETRVDSK